MRNLIIYTSHTGFTKRYAEWIAEELKGDIIPLNEAVGVELGSYDGIVYGGWLHAGSIRGLGFIKKEMGSLKEQKIAVFFTGAMGGREDEVEVAINKNFTPELASKIRIYYFQGGVITQSSAGGISL